MDELDEELITNVDSGTIKYTTLAKKLNVPVSTVHFRIKKLEKEKVISRYKGEIDWKRAGFTVNALMLINLDKNLLKSIKMSQEAMLKQLLSIMYVREGYIVTGEADLLIRIIAKDTAHLRDIIIDHIDSKEGVVKTNTMIILG